MKEKKMYVDNDELYEEIKRAQTKGYASEKLGKMLLLMHDNILVHNNFRRYSKELKEDMRSYSIGKILKSLMRFDLSKKDKCFGYYSHAIFNNYVYIIMKHYKYVNGWKGYYNSRLQKLVDAGYVDYGTAKRLKLQ